MHAGAVPAGSPKQHEFLGHIASSGRHLLQLINDVLDLSKVESGKFEFFPEPVQLPTLVREVTDTLHTGLQRKRIALGVDLDAELDDLEVDPARLKQVLYNYLSNAIKFTPDGGHVTVRARNPKGRCTSASRSRTTASASRRPTSRACSWNSSSSMPARPSSTRAPASASH